MINYDIKIKSLEIKNFRIFDKVKLDFDNNNLNSFLGRNGTGKTSLLEAINICLSENTSKFNNIKPNDFYSEDPIELIVEFTNNFFLSYYIGGYNRLLPCKKIHKIISKRDRKSPGDFFSPPYQINTSYELSVYKRRLTDKEYKQYQEEYKNFWPKKSKLVWFLEKRKEMVEEKEEEIYYFSGSTEEATYPIMPYQLVTLNKILYPKVFYFDKDRDRELLPQYNTVFADIVEELDWRYNKASNEQEKKENIKKHYKNLHDSILDQCGYKKELFEPTINTLKNDFNVDFDLNQLNFYFLDYNQPFKHSIFGHCTLKDRIINVNQCGSGISILIALSLLVNIAEQSKNPIIILIDEPELHLHANLQKNLFNYLKNKKFQSFLSTHSHLFVNQENFNQNYKFEILSDGKVCIEPCNQIELANVLFGLFGNHLNDLYLPENLILIEGKYDKRVLTKCLMLIDSKKSALLLDCGGDTKIPNKGDSIEEFFNTYFQNETWYKKYIQDKVRIIVDGDVNTDRVNGWKTKFNLTDTQVKHLCVDCLEYLYPESLVKKCVENILLRDGTNFDQKSKNEIIKVILDDEDIKSDEEEKLIQNKKTKISKQRLTEFITNNLTTEIICQTESKELKDLVDWIDS